ncbi:fimbrial biogenesis chaperone [Fangia hongkongensis]|uniref:fimbrial biogenesis chaperone n=1 Tax=Fangia hongkongensis TaxID=270495 RepID=UPI0003A376F3|nr:molecular chaperone [Fangia hongkongensis]MBK2126082.1 molecular chaperone [Fangia hongkongensis]
MKKILSFFSLCMLMLSAHAQLDPGPMLLEWDNDDQEITRTIKNTGGTTQYVKIEAFKILDPFGENKEIKLELKDMVSDLLVSPLKMVIPPNYEKLLRMSLPKGRESITEDQYYRIRIIPVEPSLDNGFFNVQEGKVKSGVTLSIAYGTLLIVTPLQKNIRYNTTHGISDGVLKVENKGNSFVKLKIQGPCRDDEVKGCENGKKVENRIVYAKQSKSFSLTDYNHKETEYVITEGNERETYEI